MVWYTDYYGDPITTNDKVEYKGYVAALTKGIAKIRIFLDSVLRDLPSKIPDEVEIEEIHRGLLRKGYVVNYRIKRRGWR